MMKTETKWKIFKGFVTLIMLAAGLLTGVSVYQLDLMLFAVSLVLAVGGIQLSIVVAFIDAIEEGP